MMMETVPLKRRSLSTRLHGATSQKTTHLHNRLENQKSNLGILGLSMAQAVSRRPLTAEARVRALSVHVGHVVDKVALGQDLFFPVLRLSPVHIDPPWLFILIYNMWDEQ
jgi:hypothetical protein